MTVPGKGGRPRKWSSDADRVRAFRARARGDDEPATVVEVLDRGDEDAAAWAQVRELGSTIEVQRAMIRALEHELRMTERSLDQLTRRYQVLEGINERLQAQLADQSSELDGIVQHGSTRVAPKEGGPQRTPTMNRAQRRAAERRDHRRG